MSEATDVLQAIDQLRRDLSGYHGQLKAHNDLRRHCDNQRERIAELEGLYVKSKAESAKLREELEAAKHDLQVFSANLARLGAENTKLRELAGIMAYCMQERDCDGCRMNGAAGTIAEPAGCDGLLDLLRELEVIV